MKKNLIQIPLNRWLNVFLLPGETGAVLVDAGLPRQTDTILERLAEHGVAPDDLRLILITHAHADHYGSAAELRQRTGAPVAVHALEADVLHRPNGAPDGAPEPARPTNKLLALLMRLPGPSFVPRMAPLEPDIVFEEEWRLDEYGVAGTVIPTPGHTAGSISVLFESGEAIVGDMIMGRLMGLVNRPGRPLIAWDRERNRKSLRALVERSARVFYASHGGPFTDVSALIKNR